MLIGAGRNAGGSGISLWHSKIFRKDCEIFAMVAKILQSQRKFAIIAKITVHSEILNFPMPQIFAMIAKFSL